MHNKLNRYQELDSLRGIAAIMVVFFHFTMGRAEAKLGFRFGTTGVELFFMISGFVIYMSLSKIKTSKDFIINRISRLYPTYWTCVTFTYLLFNLVSFYCQNNYKITFIRYIFNMTMFQYYFKVGDIDGPYWTMIIEMNFYIGILFLYHFKLLKYLKYIGIISTVIIVFLASFLKKSIINKIFVVIPLFKFSPLFFAGIIFYKIYTKKNKLIENYSLLIICLISQVLLYDFSGQSRGYFISHFEYAVMLTLYFALFILFINGKLKFIVNRVSLFLGKISFALYLVHQYISFNLIIYFLVTKLYVNFWIASICISLPIIIGLATLITYYIEVPYSKKMKEKLRTIL